jgi:cysteinyl-tRNA synthetase
MDLVVRLLLNSQNFNDNIKGSSKQLKQFENASKSIKNIIGKVGGALGIGVTAFQIFNKGMKSTQLTSDNFDNAINSAKTTVDTFFYSLVSGD